MDAEKNHTENVNRMIRYLAGELPAEQHRAFEAELAAGPAWEAEFRELESIWEQTKVADRKASFASEDWERLRNRVRSSDKTEPKSRRRPWIAVAAAIALIALVWVGNSLMNSSQTEIQMVEFAAGQQGDSLTLPDGSRIWLNRGSRLRYPEQFGEGNRNVDLSGEAFFEVHHDPEHPFVIAAGRGKVQVLGTSFNVLAPANNASVSVSVVTGKVAFSQKDGEAQAVILTAGQQALLEAGAAAPHQLLAPDLNAHAWRTGILRFEHAVLAEVVETLEKTHGRRLETDSPELDSLRFRGTLDNLSLEESLEFLSLSLKLETEDRDSVIVLKKK